MNRILLSLSFCMAIAIISFSQPPQKRSVRPQPIGKDSIKISLNEEYQLIEDSCASIVRYARYNFRERKFTGKFKDVSNADSALIVAEGTYNADGLKDGYFETRYLNGNLQAKGNFKSNKYFGKWELFYEDGKPKLSFEATDNNIKIVNAWNNEGKKIVDNGKGNYSVDLGSFIWSGKLTDGKPDGTWKATKANAGSGTTMVTEQFKNSEFKKGEGPTGEYTDSSRIILVNINALPFTNAEKMRMSTVACDGSGNQRKKVVDARANEHQGSFSQQVFRLVSPALSKSSFKPYNDELILEGEISAKGEVSKLKQASPFDVNVASEIIRALRGLPLLEPALLDGKPTPQQFVFTFKFEQGKYSFRYRFLPVQ